MDTLPVGVDATEPPEMRFLSMPPARPSDPIGTVLEALRLVDLAIDQARAAGGFGPLLDLALIGTEQVVRLRAAEIRRALDEEAAIAAAPAPVQAQRPRAVPAEQPRRVIVHAKPPRRRR